VRLFLFKILLPGIPLEIKVLIAKDKSFKPICNIYEADKFLLVD